MYSKFLNIFLLQNVPNARKEHGNSLRQIEVQALGFLRGMFVLPFLSAIFNIVPQNKQ